MTRVPSLLLLPSLELEPWQLASALVRSLHEKGQREAVGPGPLQAQRRLRELPSELDMDRRTTDSSSLVHGGIEADGMLGPYASVILSHQNGNTLRVTGVCLERTEIDGGQLKIFADELLLTTLTLKAGEPVELSLPLPESLAERLWISVRFVADDYAYVGDDLRHCVSFELHRVAIEP
jgi:hypothetical protein